VARLSSAQGRAQPRIVGPRIGEPSDEFLDLFLPCPKDLEAGRCRHQIAGPGGGPVRGGAYGALSPRRRDPFEEE